MKASMFTTLFVLSLATTLVPVVCPAAEPAAQVGVVSHVKVLSDKVPDVSSLEAWKKSFIKDGMCDQEKALAVWKSNVAFVYQDAPPTEFLHEGCVHDAIKEFNVYGYGMCCCASARTEQLSRYVGLQARGWAINAPQRAGGVLGQPLAHLGRLAGKLLHPPRRHDRQRRRHLPRRPGLAQGTSRLQRQQRQVDRVPPRGRLDRLEEGSALLADCKFYDWGGWWPAKTHGWYSTMQEYDGSHKTPFPYEYGYSQGYQVNIQLRRGERLTRNWFNQGRHVNGILHDGDAPAVSRRKIGEGNMAFLRNYGDLTEGRVGCGRAEYDVPLADGAFRYAAVAVDNIACRQDDQRGPAMHLKDPPKSGYVEIDMPTSYVYLTGQIELDAAVAEGGSDPPTPERQ